MTPKAVRKVVAYHEAGHAVVARVLGIEVASVTIGEIEDDNTAALTASAAHAARESNTATRIAGYETDAKIALAGPMAQLKMAQLKYTRNNRAAQAIETHEEDYANAKNAAVHIALLMAGEPLPEPGEITLSGAILNSYEAVLERLQRETKAMLDRHWGAVKRVAKALFERDHLDQAETDFFIAG